jgi:hypothetical protein
VYELCLGRSLPSGNNAVCEWHTLRDGHIDRSVLTRRYSGALVTLLSELMAPNAAARPSAEYVQQISAASYAAADATATAAAAAAAATTATAATAAPATAEPAAARAASVPPPVTAEQVRSNTL